MLVLYEFSQACASERLGGRTTFPTCRGIRVAHRRQRAVAARPKRALAASIALAIVLSWIVLTGQEKTWVPVWTRRDLRG